MGFRCRYSRDFLEAKNRAVLATSVHDWPGLKHFDPATAFLLRGNDLDAGRRGHASMRGPPPHMGRGGDDRWQRGKPLPAGPGETLPVRITRSACFQLLQLLLGRQAQPYMSACHFSGMQLVGVQKGKVHVYIETDRMCVPAAGFQPPGMAGPPPPPGRGGNGGRGGPPAGRGIEGDRWARGTALPPIPSGGRAMTLHRATNRYEVSLGPPPSKSAHGKEALLVTEYTRLVICCMRSSQAG